MLTITIKINFQCLKLQLINSQYSIVFHQLGTFFFFFFVVQALRIVSSVNVVVTGIKIQNSPRIHIYFDFCQHVQVFGLTVLSPAESLNTDGIHIANVQDARIYNNTVACGNFSFSFLFFFINHAYIK